MSLKRHNYIFIPNGSEYVPNGSEYVPIWVGICPCIGRNMSLKTYYNPYLQRFTAYLKVFRSY